MKTAKKLIMFHLWRSSKCTYVKIWSILDKKYYRHKTANHGQVAEMHTISDSAAGAISDNAGDRKR